MILFIEIYFLIGLVLAASVLIFALDSLEGLNFWFCLTVLMLVIFLYPYFLVDVIYTRHFKKNK
jgi:hypothetical protein